jgi:hypothetical protein
MDLSHWMEPTPASRPCLRVLVRDEDAPEDIRDRVASAAQAGFGGCVLSLRPSRPGASEGPGAERLANILRIAGDAMGEGATIRLDVLEAAAHALVEKTPECASESLRIERCTGPKDAGEQRSRPGVLGVYCLSLAAGQRVNGLELWSAEGLPPDRDEMLVSVSARRAEPAAGFLRADVLRGEVTGSLIESALEPLRETLAHLRDSGRKAGIVAPVDLPQSLDKGSVAWTRDLPRFHGEAWGGEILPRLPLLWFDGPGEVRRPRRRRTKSFSPRGRRRTFFW